MGRIYVLQKKQLNFEYEEFIGSRTELLKELTKPELVDLCKEYEIKGY